MFKMALHRIVKGLKYEVYNSELSVNTGRVVAICMETGGLYQNGQLHGEIKSGFTLRDVTYKQNENKANFVIGYLIQEIGGLADLSDMIIYNKDGFFKERQVGQKHNRKAVYQTNYLSCNKRRTMLISEFTNWTESVILKGDSPKVKKEKLAMQKREKELERMEKEQLVGAL